MKIVVAAEPALAGERGNVLLISPAAMSCQALIWLWEQFDPFKPRASHLKVFDGIFSTLR